MLLEQADDGERGPRRDERLALLPDEPRSWTVWMIDAHVEAGRSELLEALDERGLAVAGRR